MSQLPKRGKLTVVAGPTAVGKGTVISYILEHHPEIQLSVSATTRSPRPGEVEGVNYYFLTHEEFQKLIDQGEMLEYALVHGSNMYGTPRKPVVDALERGDSVLLEIDIQGARQVKAALPEAVLVFIKPPSWDELVRRLVGRGTETVAEQQRRLETAREELAAESEFDFTVINENVADCAAEVLDLIKN